MDKPKFLFGDIVIINENQIGVILKTWTDYKTVTYDIFNRMTTGIEEYCEQEIKRYRIRHKYLNEKELSYQDN